jgi:D-amino-acid oxidase
LPTAALDTVHGVDILVVGAGIVGLTTAVTLAEAGHQVRVLSAEPPQSTTSAAAGALWGPWLSEPRDRVTRWAADTLHALTDLADEPSAGVHMATGMDISTVDHTLPAWFDLLPDVRRSFPEELPDGYPHGIQYTAPLLDMPVHLAYLVARLRAAGTVIELGAVASVDLVADRAHVVVNCTGLGARTLADDPRLHPVRGQHLVVSNPGITDFLEVDTGDSPDLIAIYPHGDHVVLGGTAQPDSWNREPDPATADAILTRCTAVQPLLARANVLSHRVGLRPTRAQVRLEEQQVSRGARIIHNYGHGGAGVSLAWGCATEVLSIVGTAR